MTKSRSENSRKITEVKRAYKAPTLVSFGEAKKLIAGGVGSSPESTGTAQSHKKFQ